jgi:hypothetical protein
MIMARSERVQRMVSELRQLSDEELSELEAELLALEGEMEQAWGEEIDRRAGRALRGEETGLTREQLTSLFTMPAADARAALARMR